MSDEFDFDDEQGEGIKNLRKQYDAMKKQNDELAKQLSAFQSEKRQATVAEILKAKGVPTSAAKLYTGDDASEDAVGKWIEDFADVFHVQTEGKAGENDANANSVQRISAASFGQNTDAPGSTDGQPIMGDPVELLNYVRNAPMEELQRIGYMPKPGELFSPQRG